MKATTSLVRLGLFLALTAALGTGCSKKDAADSAAAPPPPAAPGAPNASAVSSGGMPPQAAATMSQQNAGMAAQKRMNEDMAKARQAAEQGGNK